MNSFVSLVALDSFVCARYYQREIIHLDHNPSDAMSDVIEKGAVPSSQGSASSEPGGKACQADMIEITVNGVRVAVSPALEDAVLRAHKGLLQPLPKEMTTTQAADFLDVSRPFIIKLTRRGELPCRMVGKHRRIPTDAVLEYREKMFQQARKAADEMSQLSQEADLDKDKPRRKAQ